MQSVELRLWSLDLKTCVFLDDVGPSSARLPPCALKRAKSSQLRGKKLCFGYQR